MLYACLTLNMNTEREKKEIKLNQKQANKNVVSLIAHNKITVVYSSSDRTFVVVHKDSMRKVTQKTRLTQPKKKNKHLSTRVNSNNNKKMGDHQAFPSV